MKHEGRIQERPQGPRRYKAERWRTDETTRPREPYFGAAYPQPSFNSFDAVATDARERSRLLRLLGLINYKVLTGNRVYIEVGGKVYKTLYGGYWRSVFTGVEHYLLRCQEVSGSIWADGSSAVDLIDLPIAHTKDGWTAKGHSLMFMLSRD
jgi:hypothetical protein